MRDDRAKITLHVWRTPARRLPRILWRMARDPRTLRRTHGIRFAKLLGTSQDRRFGPTRADLTRWAALVVGENAGDFGATRAGEAWRALASSYCRLDLSTIQTRGLWAGQAPFGQAHPPAHDGPVLALTRARLRASRAARFWRAIDEVAEAANTAPGLLATFGIGEAPLGWQGTVSLWRGASDLVEFAYRHPDHRRAIERTPAQRWYAEELFARFAVLHVAGDRDVIGWTGDDEREPP